MMRDLEANADIEQFIEDGWIDAVLFPVKSGKEATVYCAKAGRGRGVDYVAVKVYTPLAERNFRNAARYQEGRIFGKARDERAVRNKSRHGRAVEFGNWLHHEYAMLSRLHAAGVDVPRPLAVASTAVLMEFVGRAAEPAPQLAKVRLTPDEAEALLEQALCNIERMLAHHVVHGDLSAYNMLHTDCGLRIIDMPQAVDARSNENASRLLARDVANVCRYFAAQGARAGQPAAFAAELWEMYRRSEL